MTIRKVNLEKYFGSFSEYETNFFNLNFVNFKCGSKCYVCSKRCFKMLNSSMIFSFNKKKIQGSSLWCRKTNDCRLDQRLHKSRCTEVFFGHPRCCKQNYSSTSRNWSWENWSVTDMAWKMTSDAKQRALSQNDSLSCRFSFTCKRTLRIKFQTNSAKRQRT